MVTKKTSSDGEAQVSAYIHTFNDPTKAQLIKLRSTIRQELPLTEERISYAIPAYWDKGYIVYFAGYEKHVSLYPIHGIKDMFGDELTPYLSGKATARFPVDKPLPEELIKRLISHLVFQKKQRDSK